MEELLTPKAVKQILQVSLSHVYMLAERELLPCVRWDSPSSGKRKKSTVRFEMSAVVRFIEEHRR